MAMPDNSINNSIADYIDAMSMSSEETLKSIDLTLKAITRPDGIMISQASLQDLAQQNKSIQAAQARKEARDGATNRSSNQRSDSRRDYYDDERTRRDFKKKAKVTLDSLTDDFEDAFTEAIFGSAKPFEDNMRKIMNAFADSLGTDINGLGKELGKRFANKVGSMSYTNRQGQKTTIGDQLKGEVKWYQNKAADILGGGLNKVSSMLGGSKVNYRDIFDNLKKEEEKSPEQEIKDAVDEAADKSQQSADQIDEGFSQILVSLSNVIEAILNSKSTDKAKDIIDSDIISEEDVVDTVSDLAGLPNKGIANTAKSEVTDVIASEAGEVGTAITKIAQVGPEAEAVATGMEALAPEILTLNPELLLVAAGIEALSVVVGEVTKSFKALIASIGDFLGSAWSSFNKATEKATKLTELSNTRYKADKEAIVKAAYDVIEESANKVMETWDNVYATVVESQGYTKSGVQDLWSSYAQRLKDENLSSVVSSADIMSQLSAVLEAGLSGAVAEEFAYQATLLNAAIPTEDFFSYASTYASIAANLYKSGYSEQQAIEAANSELQSFASNVLYAKREIAGGFTTSLSNAASLFEESAQIALASRTGDVSDISGVLASVSAIVGATAPDLADSIVDAVVQAATGGNSSELTALRSLAGVGASNTAFLQALANDPKGTFQTLFSNLAQLQNMSSSNYMEVAEALSSVFGLSMNAFARVDFSYLADAISEMNYENEALEQNFELLAKGQTTSTDAQLRMAKINEYMIEEGLAYVLDNDVARSIQEHMWEEQLAQQLMENQFSVDLAGNAANVLNSLLNVGRTLYRFLTPMGLAEGITDLVLDSINAIQGGDEISQLLEEVKVGEGNAQELYYLTTRGVEFTDLASKASYNQWLKELSGSSLYTTIQNALYDNRRTISLGLWGLEKSIVGVTNDIASSLIDSTSKSGAQIAGVQNQPSYYTHKLISKTSASAVTSGDWRDNLTFNSLLDNYEGSNTHETSSELDADNLTKSITSYVQKASSVVTATDNLRSVITENTDNMLTAKDITALSKAMSVKDEDLTKGAEKGLQHRSFYTQDEILQKVTESVQANKASQGSFDKWVKEYESEYKKQTGETLNLQEAITQYGKSMEDLRQIYAESENAKTSAETRARELHEVQFWEDMQQFATVDFPWYMREWERYYIQHEAYTSATNNAYEQAVALKAEEEGELGDSVLALAKALTENNLWQQELGDSLKDPVLQTNTLLAKILLTTEAIMQQNNETSIVSVPTALSSLGLGISNT